MQYNFAATGIDLDYIVAGGLIFLFQEEFLLLVLEKRDY